MRASRPAAPPDELEGAVLMGDEMSETLEDLAAMMNLLG
jgi:hypothetical protein